jgi:hypothetical protein
MALLGKLLKGRSTRAPKDMRGVRVRRIRAQIQQEERKNEEELHKKKREFLRNNVQEEMKITNFNKKKILTEWRKIMRMAKTDELKREIEVYSHNHEREVDAKDALLQMLDKDLEEAEEQYQTALRNHMIHVDRLLRLQESRLQGLEEEFKRDLKILVNEFERERSEIVENHRLEKKELLDIISAVQEEEKRKEDALKSKHETNREETKKSEDLVMMQTKLGIKNDTVDREFDMHHTNYDNSSKDLSQQFMKYYLQNESETKKIEQAHRKVDALKLAIEKLKYEASKTEKESTARNRALELEKETVAQHYRELKKKMVQFREEEVRRLTELTNNSRSCVSKLKDQVNTGEKILKLAELCRKLETEKEKVVPFYASNEEAEQGEQQQLLRDREQAHMESAGNMETMVPQSQDILQFLNPETAFDEFQALANFYKRFNKVLLDKLAIEKQKKQLEKENLFFKSLLKQYLDGVSVNEDVLSGPNPLLVVNNRIQLNRPPVERVEQPVIEASHVIQTRQKLAR